MPSGVYIRTRETKKNLSKARRKWDKENPEAAYDRSSKGGKKTGSKNLKKLWKNDREKMLKIITNASKIAWEDNREKMVENSRKTGRKTMKRRWKEDREGMLKISGQGFKIAWKNNPEKLLDGCRKGGKNVWKNDRERMLKQVKRAGVLGGKKTNGKSLRNAWKNNRELMLANCSRTGKIVGKIVGKLTGGISFKRMWKDDRERMLKQCSEAGKLGGRKAWENREKMLENCRKGGRASIQKQRKVTPSYLELVVRKYLNKLKIKYRKNVWFEYKEADIVIDKFRLIIECDGFWHNELKTKVNDKFKTKLFNKLGYRVLRLKSLEIRDGSFEKKVLKKITQLEGI